MSGGMTKQEAVEFAEVKSEVKFTRIAVENIDAGITRLEEKFDKVILDTQENTTFRKEYKQFSRARMIAAIGAALSVAGGAIKFMVTDWMKKGG